MLNVIIPTKNGKQFSNAVESLKYIPFKHKLHVVTDGNSWAEAVNIGLANIGDGDVLLMDDDVVLSDHTFSHLENNTIFNSADIFGFKLLYPNGRIQHAGAWYNKGRISHIGLGCENDQKYNMPYLVFHCTASLLYIKRYVIDKIGNMSIMSGQQFEDVDFSARALKADFKILYTPGEAIHFESKTKSLDPDFHAKMVISFNELMAKHFTDPIFCGLCASYPWPVKQFSTGEIHEFRV